MPAGFQLVRQQGGSVLSQRLVEIGLLELLAEALGKKWAQPAEKPLRKEVGFHQRRGSELHTDLVHLDQVGRILTATKVYPYLWTDTFEPL